MGGTGARRVRAPWTKATSHTVTWSAPSVDDGPTQRRGDLVKCHGFDGGHDNRLQATNGFPVAHSIAMLLLWVTAVWRGEKIQDACGRREPTDVDALIKTIADHGSWPRQEHERDARSPQ